MPATHPFVARRRGIFRSGSGRPLVLLHCGGASWRVWTPVLGQLTAARDVLAPTLPGHLGGPPLERDTPLTLGDLADAVERELDSEGFDCPDVVGNSIGGAIAFELARRGRACRVVGIGAMGMQEDGQAKAIVRRITLGHSAASAARPALLPALALAPVRRIVLRDAVAHGERVPTALARHLVHALTWCDAPAHLRAMQDDDGRLPRVENAAQITTPTLLIRGDRDTIATHDQMLRYLDQLPDARLITLRNAGHCPQLEEPARVAREILAFTAPATVTQRSRR